MEADGGHHGCVVVLDNALRCERAIARLQHMGATVLRPTKASIASVSPYVTLSGHAALLESSSPQPCLRLCVQQS